jgi:hypothetical protein
MVDFSRGASGSEYINRKAKTIAGFYGQAYRDMKAILRDNAAEMYKRDHALVVLSRIDEAVARLDERTKAAVRVDIGDTYMAFGEQTRQRMRKLGAAVPKEFSTIHVEAIDAAAADAYLRFSNTLQGVQRSAQDFVRLAQQENIRQRIIAGQIAGAPAEETAKIVEAVIRDQGLVSMIDKAGRKIQLDTYANTLTRQMLANSSRDAVFNNAIEFGFDLVRVTTHGSDHEECAVWEGKILSLTGKTKGYPSMDQAKAAGLYHVGCLHGYFVTIDR